jgi:integrase
LATHASIPRHHSADQIAQLLDAVRTGETPSRDRAILLLLVRLGLRCAEIVAMEMDDIDWQNGLIRVCISKSHRERVLPLPCEVGTALADYIQHDRPAKVGRAVFIGVNNPPRPLHDPTAITRMVKRNPVRAGIPLGAEAFLRDNPNATVQFLETGHFALETHLEEVTSAMREFLQKTFGENS